jgi:hypothetical protein
MKIVILIILIITLIIIILFFQHKSILKFENICIYKNDELKKIELEKDNIKSISDIIDKIYDIAIKINDINEKTNQPSLLDTNLPSIKKKLDLILDDKTIINTYYNDKLDYYNAQVEKCKSS